ncbi:MAG: hypothetical protein AAGF57_04710 [Pseudomonadota bacterium]
MFRNTVLVFAMVTIANFSVANDPEPTLDDAASCAAFTQVIDNRYGDVQFVLDEQIVLDRIYENSFRRMSFISQRDGLSPTTAAVRYGHYLEQHDFDLSLGESRGVKFTKATLAAFIDGTCGRFN